MIRKYMNRRKLRVESLEDRRLLATFGEPWPAPRDLSISIPADGNSIGAYTNELNDELTESINSAPNSREWQQAVLTAFQTWSVHANINVGLVPDRGDKFGASGLPYGDPRFGEFRVGAFGQPGVVASAAPFQLSGGTWAGDLLLNSEKDFYLGTPAGSYLDPAPGSDPSFELLSVLLHESGNALGLSDVHEVGAVMHETYTGPNVTLAPSDIASIQALYGVRQDVYEPVPNEQLSQATHLSYPNGFNGSQPFSFRASINDQQDVDYFKITSLADREHVTIRLRAAGVSLLRANLQVFDAAGNLLGSQVVTDSFENNLALQIDSLENYSDLYVRVAGAGGDIFAIGDYRLEIDYRSAEQQPSLLANPLGLPVSQEAEELDSDDEEDDDEDDDDRQTVQTLSVDQVFQGFGTLLDPEVGTNDTLETATPLSTTPGFLPRTHYQLVSSLSSVQDRDLYSFQAPSVSRPKMLVSIDPVGLERPDIELIILNQAGDRIAAEIHQQADGGVRAIVDNPIPGEVYVLFIRDAAGSTVTAGNYVGEVSFADQPTNSQVLMQSRVRRNREVVSDFVTYKPQLVRFDLQATSTDTSAGVQLTIYDKDSRDVVGTLATTAGRLRSEFFWLHAGNYLFRYTRIAQPQASNAPVDFELSVSVLSDDQGPNPIDPTQPSPGYDHTIPPDNTAPTVDFVDPLIEDPWNSDYRDTYHRLYYTEFLV